jgi:hypothetical protein
MHIKQCNQYAQHDSDHMMDVALMVVLSIQQKWDGVGKQLASVRKLWARSPYLWGMKESAYHYLKEWKHELYAESMSRHDDLHLLDLWSAVPGFGLAKAGFMLQLMFNRVGCIDSHNAKLYDVAPSQLRLDAGLTLRTREIKLRGYIDLCERIGGSEYLWRNWCVNLADRYRDVYDDQYDVSARHIEYLRGEHDV